MTLTALQEILDDGIFVSKAEPIIVDRTVEALWKGIVMRKWDIRCVDPAAHLPVFIGVDALSWICV